MSTSTPIYGLSKPAVNNPVDQDQWGTELNADLDELDGLMATAIKFVKSVQTASFSVTAPTAGSGTTGDSKKSFLCNATSASIVVSLPTAASAGDGFTVVFKKTDATTNTVTITGSGTETIDGSNINILSAQYDYVVLICDGVNWNIVSRSSLSVVAIKSIVQQIFTSSGTYTPTTNMLYCIAEVVGGGGSGALGDGNNAAGGGGAGSYARARLTAAQIGVSKTVTIGAGGASPAGGANLGGNSGADSSLGSLLIGKGGTGAPAPFIGTMNGGVGGVAGTGDFVVAGEGGGVGLNIAGAYGWGGMGGSSYFGGAGNNAAGTGGSPVNGTAATGYGSGGSGAYAPAGSGGAGKSGVIIITEYCS